MIENLQFLSIALEAVIAVVLVAVAMRGRTFMFGLALTFAIYVGYDLANLLAWDVSTAMLRIGFLIATVTALYSAIGLLRQR